MQTLDRAIATRHAEGEPLNLPWHNLSQLVNLYTRELVIIAGGPGGGKSTFAINMALNMGYPVVYFAQDNATSVLNRMAAIAVGREINEVRRDLRDDMKRAEMVKELTDVRPTLVLHRGSVHTKPEKHDKPWLTPNITTTINALEEWLGHPPPLVFVDNLIDLTVPGHNFHEPQFYATALPELKQLANERNICVVLLHHIVRGEAADGRRRMTMTDLMYAGDREARHVWGVYNNGEDMMTVSVLKNQDGPADPNGGLEVRFRWFAPYGRINVFEYGR